MAQPMEVIDSNHPMWRVAKDYVLSCLAIMDGNAELGLKRIGTERFEATVRTIVKECIHKARRVNVND